MECCYNQLTELTNRLKPPVNIRIYLREEDLLMDESPSCKECETLLASLGGEREPNPSNGFNYQYTIGDDEDDETCRRCNRIFCFCPETVKRADKYDADIETDMGASSAMLLKDIIYTLANGCTHMH